MAEKREFSIYDLAPDHPARLSGEVEVLRHQWIGLAGVLEQMYPEED